jgi:hypothetical protein
LEWLWRSLTYRRLQPMLRKQQELIPAHSTQVL